MENKKTFGEYLRGRRAEKGFTQKSFADQLFVTESAVSKWERGLSYPDITLIRDICRLLEISEDELLTASVDTEARGRDRLAQRYLQVIKRVKMVQYLVYGISLLACFTCNLAVDHKLSWFFIVMACELVAATLTLLPIMVEKKRGLITLVGFTVSLLLLLLACCIYTGGNWFVVVAVSVLFVMAVFFSPYVLRNVCLPGSWSRYRALLCFCIDTALLFLLLLASDLYTSSGSFLRYMCPIAAFCLSLPWGIVLIIHYTRISGFLRRQHAWAGRAYFII